jgi:kynurenine formamidase
LIAKFNLNNAEYQIDTLDGIDISIPLNFNGEQPNIYDVDKASAKTFESGEFIGDTRRGGSCNFEEYRLIPHCSGTHTECVGHISDERIYINETLKDSFFISALVTISPVGAAETGDNYSPHKVKDDRLITKTSIENALKKQKAENFEGLIIRTLPNDDSKKSRRYTANPPPYFSLEAMKLVKELNIKHLLVDIPSVDRARDDGRLATHHIFWSVTQGSHNVDKTKHSLNTITEMIYVPDTVKDGLYLLNLQVAPFTADASPSRPVIFKIVH